MKSAKLCLSDEYFYFFGTIYQAASEVKSLQSCKKFCKNMQNLQNLAGVYSTNKLPSISGCVDGVMIQSE
jgi:hypothetical protein